MKNQILFLSFLFVISSLSLNAQDLTGLFNLQYLVFEQLTLEQEEETEKPNINALNVNNQSLMSVFPKRVYSFTKIEFDLINDSQVTLTIYDANNQEVKTIWKDKSLSKGSYTKMIKGKELPKGIYFLKLKIGDYTETTQITVIR